MKIRKILPVVLISTLGCAGLVLLTLQALQKPATYPKDKIGSSIAASAAFSDFDFTQYTSPTQKKFSIKGKRMGLGNKSVGRFIFSPAKTTEINQAQAEFYENGHTVAHILGKTAFIDAPFNRETELATFINRIVFAGGADVITEDRRTLVCNSLEWDSQHGRIRASGNCVLRYGNEMIRADFIDSDIMLKDFTFRNDSNKRLKALSRALF